MTKEIYKSAEERMKKALENIQEELAKIRTGRASPTLLDSIKVNYYGSRVPLKQVASVSAPDARLLVVQPWERSVLGEIEKAILKSDLGLTPTTDGNIIRIPIPQLTEERRKDLVRLVRRLGEEGRIAVRNVRRDANDRVKKTEKEGDISEDDAHRARDDIQKLTDKYIELVDEVISKKEQEIMEF